MSFDSGKKCALLAGHLGAHCVGREHFFRVALEGQKSFPEREKLEAAMRSRETPNVF